MRLRTPTRLGGDCGWGGEQADFHYVTAVYYIVVETASFLKLWGLSASVSLSAQPQDLPRATTDRDTQDNRTHKTHTDARHSPHSIHLPPPAAQRSCRAAPPHAHTVTAHLSVTGCEVIRSFNERSSSLGHHPASRSAASFLLPTFFEFTVAPLGG